LSGAPWQDCGTHQHVEGDSYQSENLHAQADWILVLEALARRACSPLFTWTSVSRPPFLIRQQGLS
jgi:hypothetical protein